MTAENRPPEPHPSSAPPATDSAARPAGEPVLATRGLTKVYGAGPTAFAALQGIDMSVAQGESLAIIGKSGSGKSTLMHLLALLDRPTTGEVLLDGRSVAHHSAAEIAQLRNDRFGFVFQQFFLNANQTVLDNVALPLKIAGVGRAERRERSLEMLRMLGMEDKAGNRATALSGGQKQRACIARALVNNPSVVFADEPTGNLDTATSEVVESILFDMNARDGITLVTVTHDEDLAARCGRILRLQDGLVVDEQRPEVAA